jgi:dipeptidyl aminopeptidase/acylaminoacyl peptidase
MRIRRVWLALTLLLLAAAPVLAQEGYKLPPQEVVDILDAPQAPAVMVSPDRSVLVMAHRRNMPTIAEMSQPMLRLAGLRMNPVTNGRFSPSMVTGFSIMDVSTGAERAVGLPSEDGWGMPRFSPNGEYIAVTRATTQGTELWVVQLNTAEASRVLGPELNGTVGFGGACSWMGDGPEMLCHLVDPDRGPAPQESMVPEGPIIQESIRDDSPVRTYQDLLSSPHDVAVWEYYRTSVPTLVNVETGERTALGGPAIYAGIDPSPSGEFFLVEKIVPPYSYLVTERSFPHEVEIWDAEGGLVSDLVQIPLAEGVPIGGVVTGPRSHQWVPAMDNALMWVEALDEGDPRVEAEFRDKVVIVQGPNFAETWDFIQTEFRYAGMIRGEGGLAFLSEYDRPSRTARTWQLDIRQGDATVDAELLWERNSEDIYGDPGRPIMAMTEDGERLITQRGDWIFLSGNGSSDEGDRPFLDRMNVETGEIERLWRSEAGVYEDLVDLLDDDGNRILTRYESLTEPPNYYVRDVRSGERTALTAFPDPAPQLAGVTKEFVTYERSDGVQLSGTIYLPPDYREGERRPAVVWAYPREYSNPDVAGQVRGSPYRFRRITGYSHLFLLTQGYVVFDGATMPIVGGDTANDTYVSQLVASAQAAIDKLDEEGVADPERVGVGGHSYGAFMTANLLAHSDLFRAGIARSGAYNRSLTPFGFQNERRTFWEAPEIYFAMSPFMNAQKINEPLLMIHGMADNNSGTFPIQSERLFHAVKGLGGAVRLVMLPNESHGYRARESVMHTLAEMIEWMDRWVKNPPTGAVISQP